MSTLADLTGFRFYDFFQQICAIPRESGNEKGISDYLVRFAAERGLVCRQDEALNIVIKKNASPGYAGEPPLILQAHMDMVCEKTTDSKHDFLHDPILPREEDGYITADLTTLGADNAVGMSYILAILEDANMPHPPIEAVITTNEEVGMKGMSALDASDLEGKRMINLDADEEGKLFTGCAGGTRIYVELPMVYAPVSADRSPYTLRVQGLAGGHSGIDINRNRANAIVLLARAIDLLGKKFELWVGDLFCGGKMNVIPHNASAVLWLKEADAEKMILETARINGIFSAEYRMSEPDLSLIFQKFSPNCGQVLSTQTLRHLLAAIFLLPNGVLGFSQYMKDVLDVSCNLGALEMKGENAVLSLFLRSNTNSKMDDILSRIKYFGEILGADINVPSSYPAWEFRKDSALRELCTKAYLKLNGKAPEVASIHGGLECALMTLKKSDLDMVSFGPTILEAHTSNERVEIASFINTWNLLVTILENKEK
ncbi:aminoacyl-histidine dipeptidase [Spirochaetia bacterium]|nr:aminoacyl-histidine dipeptidase [Spirochaetia bacterium]